MQAGHFISRRHSATLFEPRNVHTQDAACNIWKNGEPTNYWLFMERTYGRVVIDELIALSKTSKRFTIPELEAMIEIFNSKIKDYVKKDSIWTERKYLPCLSDDLLFVEYFQKDVFRGMSI